MSSIARLPVAPAPELQPPLQQAGIWAMLFFIFLAYSRLGDFAFPQLHLPLLSSVAALLILVLTGGLPRAFRTRAGIWLSVFTLWLIAATPFALWRGGSYLTVKDLWLKSLLVFVVIAGLTHTLDHCRRVMYTLAYAVLVVSFLALYFRTTTDGRLGLPRGGLQNPNDLAQVLLMGLPFWFLMIRISGGFRKLFAFVSIAVLLVVLVATGSRGALVAVAVMGFTLFLKSSAGTKLKLLLVFMLGLGVVAVLMPNSLARRYATLFDSDATPGGVDDEAASSMVQRSFLFRQSLWLTVRHPVLGVGPGNFALASADLSHADGKRAAWRETHNAYTQISSESGLPGLFFYLAALLFCFRRLLALEKLTRNRPDQAWLHSVSYCLLLSWVGFLTTSAFSSIAYQIHFPALMGISTAVILAAGQVQLASKSSPQPAVSPGPLAQPPLRIPRKAALT